MADNRKPDEYAIEMEKLDQNKNFQPPPPPQPRSPPSSPVANNAALSVLAYCGSSILMTVMNKYVLSSDFNLNFFLLFVQVCSSPPREITQKTERLVLTVMRSI
jgi:GDP-mannose transporter